MDGIVQKVHKDDAHAVDLKNDQLRNLSNTDEIKSEDAIDIISDKEQYGASDHHLIVDKIEIEMNNDVDQ